MALPLEGIKILDLSTMLPGPFCSMILADFGAGSSKLKLSRAATSSAAAFPRSATRAEPFSRSTAIRKA